MASKSLVEKGKIVKIRYIYITENAKKLAEKISLEILKNEKLDGKNFKAQLISYREFKEKKKEIFKSSDFLIFIMATGIVVRSLAPLLESKFTDPGVVVIDELGKNVISLLSGHIGGANELSNLIAKKIGANPVITTATDINEKASLDMLVKYTDAQIDKMRDRCLAINSRLLKNEKIYIFIQKEYRNLLKNAINGFTIIEDFVNFKNIYQEDKSKYFIMITDRVDYIDEISDLSNKKNKKFNIKKLNKLEVEEKKYIANEIILLIPRKNFLGIGCRKNIDENNFEKAVLSYLDENNISIKSIKKLASIDIKKNEKAILKFSQKYFIEREFFTVDQLSKYDFKYKKSEFVKKTVGVYSVAQPSCHILCEGNIIAKKYKKDGITISLGRKI